MPTTPALVTDLSAPSGPSGSRNSDSGSRLGWLDALRGIAALAVVVDHLTYFTLIELKTTAFAYFYPGWFGVALFFLVSGYIIPASLERRGSLRRFWLSRIFRLYPIWAVAVGAICLLSAAGLISIGAYHTDHPVRTALGHLTMLQSLIEQQPVMQLLWTLSFEMVFYLLVSALFVTGLHRRSGLWALTLIGATALLGFVVQPAAGTATAHHKTAFAVAGLFAIAIAGFLIGRRLTIAIGAVAAVALCVGLLSTSGLLGDWRNIGVLALMFTGTVLYRAERGQMPWPRAIAVTTIVGVLLAFMMALPAPRWFAVPRDEPRWSWLTATLLAVALFSIGLKWRPSRVPGWLAWLGRISYSVYLLHSVLIFIMLAIVGEPDKLPILTQVGLAAVLISLLLALSTLTYRFVEDPFQRWGSAFARRIETRFGSDAGVAPLLSGSRRN
ncbi:acyltransferase [Dactylosporangium sp. NPDC051484]|uniref:acyltransferase family protein n=1 Tax=Dactylosporangium sp. NPDC051484 TaxID=3154942 RepID=UPI00344C96C4